MSLLTPPDPVTNTIQFYFIIVSMNSITPGLPFRYEPPPDQLKRLKRKLEKLELNQVRFREETQFEACVTSSNPEIGIIMMVVLNQTERSCGQKRRKDMDE